MLICYYTVGGMFPNGKIGDLDGTGNLVFLILVITVNIKVFLSSSQYGAINIVLMLLSDASAIIVIYLVAKLDPYTYVGLQSNYLTFWEGYAIFFFCTFAFILWDAGSVYANTEIRKWMEIKKLADRRIENENEEESMNFEVSQKIAGRDTRGFAFA